MAIGAGRPGKFIEAGQAARPWQSVARFNADTILAHFVDLELTNMSQFDRFVTSALTQVSQIDLTSLGLTVAIIALVLLAEHYLMEGMGKPWNYAIGLPTSMGGMLLWAVIEGLLPWPVAAFMLLGACLAGVPDFFIIIREQRRAARAWGMLVRKNRGLAASLALIQKLGQRDWIRFRDWAENISFSLGAAAQELERLEMFRNEYAALFDPILEAVHTMEDGGDK